MFKNVSGQKLTVFAYDVTTGLPKTGDAANLTAYGSIDDGTVTVLTDTSATEASSTNAAGYYVFDLSQAETNGNKILFTGKSSTSNVVVVAVPAVVYTLPANFATLSIDSSGRIVLAPAGMDAVVVETGMNARQSLSVIAAATGGVLSGAGTGTITIKGANVATTRLVATTDSSGNRTGVTLTLP